MMMQTTFLGPPETLPALTVLQPWAHLIACGKKKIENRKWETRYRGPLVIHAGKSESRLGDYVGELPEQLPLGVVLGVVDLVACLRYVDIVSANVPDEFNWTRTHDFAEGPWCWVLENIRTLQEPIPYRGAQGLWKIHRRTIASLFKSR